MTIAIAASGVDTVLPWRLKNFVDGIGQIARISRRKNDSSHRSGAARDDPQASGPEFFLRPDQPAERPHGISDL
jgi:hypothetical protein